MKSFLMVGAFALVSSSTAAEPVKVLATPQIPKSLSSLPQAIDEACEKMTGRYDDLGKDISLLAVEGKGINDPAQKGVRQAKIANDYAEGAQILTIMAARKCTISVEPLNRDAYSIAATRCIELPTTPDICKTATWQRDPQK